MLPKASFGWAYALGLGQGSSPGEGGGQGRRSWDTVISGFALFF